jgi:hypothetical protein
MVVSRNTPLSGHGSPTGVVDCEAPVIHNGVPDIHTELDMIQPGTTPRAVHPHRVLNGEPIAELD